MILNVSAERTRPTDPVEPYVEAVLGGALVTGRLVQLAAERHRRDRTDGPARGLLWNPTRAARAINFFEMVLRLPESGAPFVLFSWERFVIASIFGWLMPDGTRRFRTAYLETAKGSGKTPLGAGVLLYMALEDGEREAQCYSAAPSRDQSLIAFRDAAKMAAASPGVRARVDVQEQALFCRENGGVIRPLSAEGRTLDGHRTHSVLLDELHEHHDRVVVDKMKASVKGRRQPLVMATTNAGWDRNSVCWQYRELTRQILEGAAVQNDEWFGFIASLDEADDWRNEAYWLKANPSLPALPGVRYLREQVVEAEAMPSRQSIVLRLNFSRWVESASTWLDMGKVRTCAVPSLELGAFAGQPCVIGVDIGTTESLTVVALVFRGPDGITTVAVHGFMGADLLLERAHRDRMPYPTWVEAGHLTLTPGPIVQLEHVRAYLKDVATWATVQVVAYDDWGAVSLAQSLEADGFTVVKVDQSPKGLTAACREFERLVAEGQLRYASPLLEAHCANAMVRVTDAGMMPQKASDTQRIDALSATLTALAHVIATPPEPASVYDTRGILTV
jgi:phage terminase large subunit-like protein